MANVSIIKDINMPVHLRIVEERIDAGGDPDEIKGVEQLWLYRMDRDKEKIFARQNEFFGWLREQKRLGNIVD